MLSPQCPAGCSLWTGLHGLQRSHLVHQVCLETSGERKVCAFFFCLCCFCLHEISHILIDYLRRYIFNFFYCHVCLFNSVTEAEAKDVHRSLKMAAGIFKNLKVRHIYRPAFSLCDVCDYNSQLSQLCLKGCPPCQTFKNLDFCQRPWNNSTSCSSISPAAHRPQSD